jgi:flagellar FliL protein
MAQEAPAAPPKKSRKTLIMAAAVVLALVGGGGAYWMYAAAPGARAAEPPPKPPAILPIEPFVVNLADSGGRRFIRLTVTLVIEGEEHVKRFEEDAIRRARVRSALIEMLSQQSADALVKPDGKTALKKSVTTVVATHADHLKISDVLFTEFIVQ